MTDSPRPTKKPSLPAQLRKVARAVLPPPVRRAIGVEMAPAIQAAQRAYARWRRGRQQAEARRYFLGLKPSGAFNVLLVQPPFPVDNWRHKKVVPLSLLYLVACAGAPTPKRNSTCSTHKA